MRVFLTCFLILTAQPVWSEERVALVIGVGDYAELRPLANPRNDARAMDNVLFDLGFDVDVVTDRDLPRLKRTLNTFAEDASEADLAVIYFAGHGIEVSGENLLFARDSETGSLDRLRATALPLSALVDAVLGAKAGLLLIDACRTDAFGVPVAGASRGAVPFGTEVSRGLGRIGRADNLLYAFAAAPGQGALDGDGENSPFAAALVRHLDTEGLEIRSALTLVQQDVYDRTRGVQLPYVESGLPALVFAAGTTKLPERELLLLAMSEVTTDDRAAVERIAADFGVPLAPLFAALFTAGLSDATVEARDRQLREAANAFMRVREDLRALSSDDPRVTTLRQEAEHHLSLGAFDSARQALTEAAEIDKQSRLNLRENYRARALSEAETHYLNAKAAMADLRRPLAIQDFLMAAALYDEVRALDAGKSFEPKHILTLQGLGEAEVVEGNLSAARDAFERMRRVASAGAEADPDNASWRRDLSLSHTKLGELAEAAGDLTSAREAYEAGLEIRKALSASDPANTEWQWILSVSHGKLGDVAEATGDLARARTSYEASLDIVQRLVALDPDNTEWQRGLFMSQTELGGLAEATGDLGTARAAQTAAHEIVKRLVAWDPENTEWQRDLSLSYNKIGDLAVATGDLNGAREAQEASLNIRKSLVASDPSNTQWLRDLSVSYTELGSLEVVSGNLTAARKALTASMEIQKRLVAQDPENALWQWSLAISHERLADVAETAGDLSAARAAYEASQEIVQQLVALDPGNTEWQRGLFVNHIEQGELAEATGDLVAAHEAYLAGHVIVTRLAALDEENADWQRSLSVSHNKLGEVAEAAGDLTGARDAYEKGLAIRRQLVARDQENTHWQRDLSVTLLKLGDVAVADGDPGSARAAYMESRQILEKLAAKDPKNALWQWSLAVSHYKVSIVVEDRLPNLRTAITILEKLEAADRLSPQRATALATMRQQAEHIAQDN